MAQRKRWRAIRAYLRSLRPGPRPPRVIRLGDGPQPLHHAASPYQKPRYGAYCTRSMRTEFERWLTEFNPLWPKLAAPLPPKKRTAALDNARTLP